MRKTHIIVPILVALIYFNRLYADGDDGVVGQTQVTSVAVDETKDGANDNSISSTPLSITSAQNVASRVPVQPSSTLPVESITSTLSHSATTLHEQQSLKASSTVGTDPTPNSENKVEEKTESVPHQQTLQQQQTEQQDQQLQEKEDKPGTQEVKTESSPDASAKQSESVEVLKEGELDKPKDVQPETPKATVSLPAGNSELPHLDTPPAGEDAGKTAKDDEAKTEEEKTKTGDKADSDFQSYTEWRQKILEEEQRSKQDTTGTPSQQVSTTKQKLRMNYSSRTCGAKVVASNPEVENVQGILTANKDDYLLNPCSAPKKWFTIELCQFIQLRSVEIASLELFSSQPKKFRVMISDRFPAKEWHEIGEFEATQEKVPQAFSVEDEMFAKFVKVELLEHYGNEHFCPVTLFRVLGLPEDDDDSSEQTETPNSEEENVILQDGDEDESKENSKTLFSSAKDTVVKLVKKVLNVEEATKATAGNDSNGNFSSDGYLLPCVEEPAGTTESETARIPTVTVPEPTTTPMPGKDPPIVTKLQDNEQIPHGNEGNSLVTLVDSHPGLTYIAACNSNRIRNKSNLHKTFCSYIEAMMGKVQQTCSLGSDVTERLTHPEKILSTPAASQASPQADPIVTSQPPELEDTTMKSVSSDTPASQPSSKESVIPSELSTPSSVQVQNQDSKEPASAKEIFDEQKPEKVAEVVKKESDSKASEEGSSDNLDFKSEDSECKSPTEPGLEPSTPPLADGESEAQTETPTLEVKQEVTTETKPPSMEESSLTDKVSPSPTSAVMTSEDISPTQVAGSASELVDSETSKDNVVKKVDTSEQVVKAQNITAAKDEHLDLVHVPLGQVSKRENAIMRLTNRIKALELNVSLSSRFLDELSHRFKKQSEEMMKLLNKTIAHVNTIAGQAEARDVAQQEQLDKLESRVENLTAMMSELSVNMEDLKDMVTDRQVVWTTIQFVMLTVVCIVCLRRGSSKVLHPDLKHLLDMMPKQPQHFSLRRNSVSTIGHVTPSTPLRKQASDTALVMCNTCDSCCDVNVVEQHNLLLGKQPQQRDGSKKKKKKKHKNLESKSSTDVVPSSEQQAESLCSTQLTESAGLLFGTDAVTVLTGALNTDTSDTSNLVDQSSSHKSSTKSLPTHSRQGSKSSAEIQSISVKQYSVPPQKHYVPLILSSHHIPIDPGGLPSKQKNSDPTNKPSQPISSRPKQSIKNIEQCIPVQKQNGNHVTVARKGNFDQTDGRRHSHTCLPGAYVTKQQLQKSNSAEKVEETCSVSASGSAVRLVNGSDTENGASSATSHIWKSDNRNKSNPKKSWSFNKF